MRLPGTLPSGVVVRRGPGGCASGGRGGPAGVRPAPAWPPGRRASSRAAPLRLWDDDRRQLPRGRTRGGLLRTRGARAGVLLVCAPAAAGGSGRAAAGRCAGRERGDRDAGRGRGPGRGRAGRARRVHPGRVRAQPAGAPVATSTRPAPGWLGGCTGSTRPPPACSRWSRCMPSGQGGDGSGWVLPGFAGWRCRTAGRRPGAMRSPTHCAVRTCCASWRGSPRGRAGLGGRDGRAADRRQAGSRPGPRGGRRSGRGRCPGPAARPVCGAAGRRAGGQPASTGHRPTPRTRSPFARRRAADPAGHPPR